AEDTRSLIHIRESLCNVAVAPLQSENYASKMVEKDFNCGDVGKGGVGVTSVARVRRDYTAMSSESMYSESRALLENIADVMSVQKTPTYKGVFAWLKDFHDNLKHGNVPAGMPPAEDAGASQFTIATLPHMPPTSVSLAPDVSTTLVTVASVTPGSEDVSMSPVEEEYEDKTPVPPQLVDVNDVEALLDGSYIMDTAKDVLVKFNPPVVSPTQALDVRNFNVGQQLPQPKTMLPLDTMQSATRAIHDMNSTHYLLSYWPNFGYATLEHLELMERIINAKTQLRDATLTLVWINRVEWCASNLMKEVYVRSRVGMVNPSYHAFSSLAKTREVAAGYGAADPNNECVIHVLNISEVHSVAFHLGTQDDLTWCVVHMATIAICVQLTNVTGRSPLQK
ncbi:hypothetical protein BBJ28_00022085, partial [Nothophytophthora sp. Chile5]